jgi:thiamine biosynthesis lipoprotein
MRKTLPLVVLAAAGFAPHGASAPPKVAVERRVASMGTLLALNVVGPSREAALAASEQAVDEIRRVEDLLTTWRDSPLSRLDAAPVDSPFALDAELFGLLESVFAWSERTERAFDPTVLPLVLAWDLRGSGRVPSREDLARAVDATGTGRIRLDPAGRTAVRLNPLAGIEEGAWGKGYSLDRAAGQLQRARVAALLDFGGQILALGRDEAGRPWSVGIADPRRRDRDVMTLQIADVSAATSGNSERSRSAGGRRIGHLLDPRTGEPAADFGSVTVVCPSAFDADVLSTALFVLGPDAGLALSERLRRQGFAVEALYLVARGTSTPLEARFSPGFTRYVLSTDGSAVQGLPTHRPF